MLFHPWVKPNPNPNTNRTTTNSCSVEQLSALLHQSAYVANADGNSSDKLRYPRSITVNVKSQESETEARVVLISNF